MSCGSRPAPEDFPACRRQLGRLVAYDAIPQIEDSAAAAGALVEPHWAWLLLFWCKLLAAARPPYVGHRYVIRYHRWHHLLYTPDYKCYLVNGK